MQKTSGKFFSMNSIYHSFIQRATTFSVLRQRELSNLLKSSSRWGLRQRKECQDFWSLSFWKNTLAKTFIVIQKNMIFVGKESALRKEKTFSKLWKLHPRILRIKMSSQKKEARRKALIKMRNFRKYKNILIHLSHLLMTKIKIQRKAVCRSAFIMNPYKTVRKDMMKNEKREAFTFNCSIEKILKIFVFLYLWTKSVGYCWNQILWKESKWRRSKFWLSIRTIPFTAVILI